MKKQNYKIQIIILAVFLTFFVTNFIFADSLKTDLENRLTNVGKSGEYDTAKASDADVATYIGNIISYFLAMLGVIFLVLLIYGGFLWMTAQGESEEVTKAKDIMYNAVIGLIIVLMSYAISYYVVSKVASTTITSI